ncbi:MAG: STAS domain-containing protein [Burkholderiaceae bacterium]
MKIFSFFGRRQQAQDNTRPLASAYDGREKNILANSQVEHIDNNKSSSVLSARRNAARTTELKIDAIESAMSRQLDDNPSINGTSDILKTVRAKAWASTEFSAVKSSQQLLDMPTEILFDNRLPDTDFATAAAALPTPLIEEAAILFANDQQALAEQLLQNAILKTTLADEVEDAYLLLFDLYQLSGQQEKFDSLVNDYIVRCETSPPEWRAATQQKPFAASASREPEQFVMPQLVTGDARQLLEAIQDFAAEREIIMLDCSHLNRIEFSASRQLLAGLLPLAKNGKILEFHAVNQPVAALLNVMGLHEIARIIARKG